MSTRCQSEMRGLGTAGPLFRVGVGRGSRDLLRVSQDDDDGVIRVDDDPIRRTAPLGVLSGAVVGVVTALPSG
jgi:hypothetical protein